MLDRLARRLRSLRSRSDGSVMVEMSILTPVLLVIGLGIFEFGNLMYQYQLIETGLKDAARFLARRTNPIGDQALGQNLAVTGQIASGGTPRVDWWSTANVTVTVATVANPIDATTGERTYRGPDPLRIVRVSTTATYPGLGWLTFIGVSPSITFTQFHEERVIGE